MGELRAFSNKKDKNIAFLRAKKSKIHNRKEISWFWKVSNFKSEIFNEYKVCFGHVKGDTTSTNSFVNKTVQSRENSCIWTSC